MNNNFYQTSPSSLFAAIARGDANQQENGKPVTVICPGCQSDDTKPVDLEFDLFECTSCGAVFTRQPQEAQS